jgi:hypothetical protein
MLHSAMPKYSNAVLRDTQAWDPPQLAAMKALGQIATEARQRPGRKVLLWVGPGAGIGSGKTIAAAGDGKDLLDTADWFSTLLREARIALYTFSVGESVPLGSGATTPSALPFWQKFLDGPKDAKHAEWMHLYKKVMAVQSGGRAFDQSGDPFAQMDQAVAEAGVFYTLSFDPLPAEHFDEYHALQVQIGRPGLTVHTNTGYYDQPYYADRPNPAMRQVTVEQVDAVLSADRGKSDTAVAKELTELVLTERLSTAKRAAWTAELRGEKARQALTALADASAFLDPPPAEIPADAPPEIAAQRRTIAHAVEYLGASIPKLPNTFATRTMVRYQEPFDAVKSNAWLEAQPLRQVDSTTATVVYRQGGEVVDAGKRRPKAKAGDPSLTVNGTFGPLLSSAAEILAMPGSLRWSRWGQEPSGRIAVFRYTVPAEKLSYSSRGCCMPDGDGTIPYHSPSTYSGEIEMDPVSGALLRLELSADLKSTTPLVRSDLVIEYGPVEIAGKTYICPLRSVSMVRLRLVNLRRLWDEEFRTYAPYTTLLNDMEFDDYHVFRAKAQILWTQSGQPAPQNEPAGQPPPGEK